jgi:hypothetical protein
MRDARRSSPLSFIIKRNEYNNLTERVPAGGTLQARRSRDTAAPATRGIKPHPVRTADALVSLSVTLPDRRQGQNADPRGGGCRQQKGRRQYSKWGVWVSLLDT